MRQEAIRQSRIARQLEILEKFQKDLQASMNRALGSRSNDENVGSIPIEEGGELTLSKNSLGENAISQENFENGETVEVLYSEAQAKQKRESGNVNVKPSMVYKSSSVEALVKRGDLKNPITREPIALRERRTLRFLSGGKRKTKKNKRKILTKRR